MSEHTSQPLESLELHPDQGQKLSVLLLGAATVGIGLSLLGLAMGDEVQRKQFFLSYLVAFVFVIQILTGCLFWVLLHHLVDAGWSVVFRRIAENYASVLLFAGVFVLPVLAGMGTIYSWTHEHPGDHLLEGKRAYLNVPFFIVRTAIYFAVWAWLAWKLVNWSKQQDQSGDPALTRKMQGISAPGMILLGLTTAFAGIDWIMTLDYTWFSTMFGVYFWAGAIVSSMCAIALTTVLLQRAGLLTKSITEEHLHDLGKLMFAFTIFWAYITFSQYFLIWYADIPEETTWYSLRRWVGHGDERHLSSWHWFGVFIVFGHVILPFLVLLPRANKRNPVILGGVAVWLLVVHFLEIHYEIMPSVQTQDAAAFKPSWLDLTTVIGLSAAAGFFVLRAFKSTALLPKGDPRLQESLAFENV